MPASPKLATNRIRLRPLSPADHRPLYDLVLSDEINYLWRFRGATPSFNQFVESLQPGVLCQFAICPAGKDDLLGIVVGYNADLRNRFCYAAICLTSDLTKSGVGVEAFILFINYLFHCWEFRKIYIESSEINYRFFESGEALGVFSVEGRFLEHMYMAGRFWDQYVLAVSRDQMDGVRASSLGRFLG